MLLNETLKFQVYLKLYFVIFIEHISLLIQINLLLIKFEFDHLVFYISQKFI